jgi:uncharacterized membrane protein YbhN (UPF0104 family)
VSNSPRVHRLIQVGGALLGIAMIVVVAQSLRRDGPAALEAWRAARVRWSWVSLSVVWAMTAHVVYIVGWRRLLHDSEIRVRFWDLVRMTLVSNIGRYLPAGKAWQMGIIAMMSSERDLPPAIIAGSSLLQGMIGVAVGAIVLFAAGGTAIGLPLYFLVLPVLGVIGMLLAPRVLRAVPRLHALLAKKVHGIDSIDAATMWTLIWTSAAAWILWGVALHALATALLPSAGASLVAYVAAWTGSFLAGLIAVFSPAGLGAREGVMQAVLEQAGMSGADVLVVALVARAWVTVLDVVPAVLVFAVRQRRAKPAPPVPNASVQEAAE